jgi:20S proteasome subunit beta 4
MGSCQEMDKAAHGYAAHFLYGLLDRHWKPNMPLSEGIELMKSCIEEMQRRFILAQPKFQLKCVDVAGVRELEVN